MRTGPGLYSRIVAILKVTLPLVALGLLSALFLNQSNDGAGGEIVFSRGDLASLGSGLRVSEATFSGTTEAGDSFRFTAAEVTPDAAPPSRAGITTLAGVIDFAGGPSVEVSASSGDLDIDAQLLELTGDVLVETSDGYSMQSERMSVDLRGGMLDAGEPVLAEGPLGRIEARTLRVTPAGGDGEARRFSFGNGVRVVYDPPSPAD